MNKKLIISKHARSQRRQQRVRAKITGTASRPRLVVTRSLQHIACQLIDDTTGKTLAAVSDGQLKATGTKTNRAQLVGQAMATAAQQMGVTMVVFDRAGHQYHGRVQALAEAARAAGLQF